MTVQKNYRIPGYHGGLAMRVLLIALSLAAHSLALAAISPSAPFSSKQLDDGTTTTRSGKLSSLSFRINTPPSKPSKIVKAIDTQTHTPVEATPKSALNKTPRNNEQIDTTKPPQNTQAKHSRPSAQVQEAHVNMELAKTATQTPLPLTQTQAQAQAQAQANQSAARSQSVKPNQSVKQNQNPSTHTSSSKPLFVSTPSFAQPPSAPRYPRLAQKRGQQGTVWLEVWIDHTGSQVQLQIAKSSGTDMLDMAAAKAVARWKFKPHFESGVAIASRLQIPIEFALH